MIIKVDTIPATGFKVRLEEGVESFKDDFIKSGYTLTGPVRAALDLTVSKGSVYIEGRVTAPFKARCDRCLEEFSFKVDTPVALLFTRLKGIKGEVELKATDMDVTALKGDEIDTSEILLSQIAMEIPLSALCRDDCMGLCHVCGADLNREACRCVVKDKVDTRLAALKGFKAK